MTNDVRRGDCRVIEKQAVLDALEKERKVLLQRKQIGAEHVLVHHAILVVEAFQEEKDGEAGVIEFIKPSKDEHGGKEHTYCGKTWEQMNRVLDIVCELEDRIEMTDEEQEAFDIAIQCITTVMNRMKDDSPIEWD